MKVLCDGGCSLTCNTVGRCQALALSDFEIYFVQFSPRAICSQVNPQWPDFLIQHMHMEILSFFFQDERRRIMDDFSRASRGSTHNDDDGDDDLPTFYESISSASSRNHSVKITKQSDIVNTSNHHQTLNRIKDVKRQKKFAHVKDKFAPHEKDKFDTVKNARLNKVVLERLKVLIFLAEDDEISPATLREKYEKRHGIRLVLPPKVVLEDELCRLNIVSKFLNHNGVVYLKPNEGFLRHFLASKQQITVESSCVSIIIMVFFLGTQDSA